MPYIGTQPNDVKKNTGIYTPSDILELSKQGHWGGSLKFIAESNHSGDVNNIEFNAIKETEYDVHVLQIENFKFETSIGRIGIQLREAGTYETAGVYHYAVQYIESTGGNGVQKQNNYEYMQLEYQLSTAGTMNAYVYLYNLGNSSKYSFMSFQESMQGSSYFSQRYGAGSLPQASAVDGIRIMRSGSNNFTNFNIKLYGVKQV